MNRRAFLTALAALALVGSLAFAGGGKEADSSGGGAGKKKDFSKRVTLTIAAFMNGTVEPDGRKTDPVAKLMEQQVNADLEFTAIDEANWPTQFAALMAAGDLPDIFMLPFGETKPYNNLIAQKGLLAMDDYLKDYAPNSAKNPLINVMFEGYRAPNFSPDGKLYAWGLNMGDSSDGIMPACSHALLWDTYKKAGYPPINSLEDLPDALEKMLAVQPKSLSGEKTYALGAWGGEPGAWGEWHINYGNFWENGEFPVEESVFTVSINTVDSTPVNRNNLTDYSSPYWRMMKFYNTCYQRGILDPDSLTQKYGMFDAKVRDARYMFVHVGWIAESANNNELKSVPGNTHFYIGMPTFNKDKEIRHYFQYLGERKYGINSKTKYPERCVALLDYISTYAFSRIAWSGVEGMNWNMVNGVPTPTEAYLKGSITPDLMLKTGAEIYDHFVGYYNGTIDPATGVAVNLFRHSPQAIALRMNPTFDDFCQHYGKKTLLDVYNSVTPHTNAINLITFGDVPDDIRNSINGLLAYKTKNYAKVIMAKNDAEFAKLRDEFVAGMKEYNVDGIFKQFYNDALKQAGTVKKLVGMINAAK